MFYFFYHIKWIQQELDRVKTDINKDEKILIIKNRNNYCNAIIEKIKNQGIKFIEVEFGPKFKKIEDYKFQVCSNQKDFDLLINEIKKEITQIAEESGGYVESAYDNYIIIRVPAQLFSEIFTTVLGLGEILYKSVETYDVTEFYSAN